MFSKDSARHSGPLQGYYYSLGGGWITNGPARSKSLAVGSWEVSPLAPMAIPAARASNHSLPPVDMLAGINTDLYSQVWKRAGGVPSDVALFLKNMTAWNWGVTDPDVCCNDGKAPSYMLHTLSQQGGKLPPGTKTWNMAALGTVNQSCAATTQPVSGLHSSEGAIAVADRLNEWLRGYFPKAPAQTLKLDDTGSRARSPALAAVLVLLLPAGTRAHPLPNTPIHAVKNVREFGAKGDGDADDTAAIKDAIVAARSQHSNTGAANLYSPIVLFFPRGECD